ncbi:MAG: hypothetical protein GYA23_04240 [Methanomicrobiales archaeon]|nr:hypothetical protein [Methanomicrobiales archaeon]
MTGSEPSDILKNLIFFIIGLALLGIIVALILFVTGLAPLHQALPPVPLNAIPTIVDGQIT